MDHLVLLHLLLSLSLGLHGTGQVGRGQPLLLTKGLLLLVEAGNEMTSDFSAYLDKEGDLSDLASTNQDEHNEVFVRASDNTNMLEQVFSSADANGQALIGLRNIIDQQRAAISQQWTQIEAQQELCFDVMDGKD